jgi:DNA-binding transcriptional ArsR family regulator
MPNFSALADPTRQRILEMLADRPHSAGEIAQAFDISAPAISQHLKVLREAQLVQVRTQAQHRIYELDPRGFQDVNDWLRSVARFWDARLDDLETALTRDDAEGAQP